MADTVLALVAAGHSGPLHVISRHGLLPLPHAHGGLPSFDPATLLPMNLRQRLRALRQFAGQAQAEGMPWQGVMDRIRPHGQALWCSLDEADQRRFLRLPTQGHDRCTGGDVLAAFEVHLLDDFADLGGDADRLARLGRAQRLQGVVPLRGPHHLRGHRHRFALPTRGGLLLACAPGQHGQAEAKGQGRSDTSQHERSRLIHGRRV
ncbi:hypothetical protein G6F51_013830 [Rhizopus arrhizus]|uniref:Uncharacterized protein n=1 Tax=Rhizopus oryzae TaxID=64495 RepID=A0A9P6XQI5_RHIOR|nr:hypothetical protein G6F51_013830 [Rhizopus arrhizus]